MKKENIVFFDTTLRDGEQSPGASMNINEKIQIALQLEKLGVDVIEAGFAAASIGDGEAIQKISEAVTRSSVCSLARAVSSDIDKAGKAIQNAKKGRIHTFIATSKIHMEHKLNMTHEQVIKTAINAVTQAKGYVDDVEFSFEDAGRSDIGFLVEMCDAVINSGATTINIPDTVGILMPQEIGHLVRMIDEYVGDRAIISVHNHNDLGMGVANSIEAIKNGARQIECTINGIGERAGNAALEEIVMIMETKKEMFSGFTHNINTKEIYKTSKIVENITGITPQPNKAIIGSNAFAHESGIHQDGMIKNKTTYQIIEPEDIGFYIDDTLVLGKHSGRAAVKNKAEKLGYSIDNQHLDEVFDKFKALCDTKKDIYEEDLVSIISNILKTKDGNDNIKLIEIKNKRAEVTIEINGTKITSSENGNGIIDGIFKSIDHSIGREHTLTNYKVSSVSQKKDSQAEAIIKIKHEDKDYIGRGVSTDTIEASARAYINAINKIND